MFLNKVLAKGLLVGDACTLYSYLVSLYLVSLVMVPCTWLRVWLSSRRICSSFLSLPHSLLTQLISAFFSPKSIFWKSQTPGIFTY